MGEAANKISAQSSRFQPSTFEILSLFFFTRREIVTAPDAHTFSLLSESNRSKKTKLELVEFSFLIELAPAVNEF
jgi:hypothetical protein